MQSILQFFAAVNLTPKRSKFLLPIIMLFFAASSYAQTNGIYESYAIVSTNGGANTFYDLLAVTGNPDFQGSNLGSFNASNSLVIKGGQNKTFKCSGGDITNGNLRWRVWLTSAGASGSFNAESMSFVSNDAGGCGGNQTWQGTSGVTNIISGLTVPGNYTVEVYSDADGVPGTAFASNGGANYKATFTYCGPTTGALPVGNYAIPGCFANVQAAVTYINANGVTGTGTVQFDIAAGGSETAPAGGISITATGTATTAIKFVKAAGAAYTITAPTPQASGILADALIKIIGGDYITIDGLTLLENAANTTTAVGTNNMTEFGVALFYATTTNGAQNNTIQNCIITLNRTYLNTFGIYSSSRTSATAVTTAAEATTTAGSNSNNKIYSNAISNVNYGIVFIGTSSAAAFDTGNDIGGNSSTTGNILTNWGGGAALSSYTNLTGNNYCIFSNHQINDNISYNTITSATLAQAVTAGGILKNYSVTSPTSGTITTTINNNTVTVINNSTGTTTGGIIGVNNQGLTPLLSTATMSMNNNTVQNCVLGGSTSTTAGITAIANLSLPGTMNITGNSVINNAITATTATTGINLGISNSGAAGTVNLNTNIVRSLASTSTSGQIQGIVNTGAVVTALNINNNQFGNATSGFFSTSTATSGSLFGISTSSGASTCALSIQTNDFRGITYNVAASAAQTYITNTAATLSQNISNNTFTNLNVNTTGNVTFVNNAVAVPASGSMNVNTNSIVTAFNKGGAGGTVTFYSSNASSATGSVINFQNNNISNVTVTGATSFVGINNTDGGSPTKTITGNTFNNISGGTGAINPMTINFLGGASSVSTNTITNISWGAAVTALTIGGSSSATTLNVNSNIINTISSTAGAVIGIANTTPSTTLNMGSNKINTLSTTLVGVTNIGISYGGTAATANIFKNKIYDISGNNAGTIINGMLISGGGTNTNIYNNLIGDLRATAATITAPASAVIGVNLTSVSSTTNLNVYYNTVYLNASSSGTNFGTSGIFHAASATATTAVLNLRNNVVVNNSTAAGTGLTVAYRRSSGIASTLANYASTSNNNIFYAGTPGASNLIYSDGTSSAQTMSLYKTGAFTAGTIAPRDSNSVTENVPFINNSNGALATFLHIDTAVATQVESGGTNISTFTDDFDGDSRNASTPDVGADEGTFTLADLSGPSITYTNIANTACLTAPNLSATITDASNVNVTAGTKPRLYYKLSTTANAIVGNTSADNGWKYVEATNAVSPFTFTPDYSIMLATPTNGDVVQYFIVAQDLAGTPNIGANSGSFNAAPTSVALTGTAAPIGGTINSYTLIAAGLSGTVTIGAAGTYTSLTGATGLFNAINTSGLASNLTVNILDASVAETGAIALNQITSTGCAGGPYSVTIKPNTGVTTVLSGSLASAALIKLNGADNVTIDGSNAGTSSQNMTITNTNTTAPTAVSFVSLGAGLGATNNTIKNCLISTGVATSIGYGISVGGNTPGTGGADNDNTTIQNNNITVAPIGIYANGTAAVTSGGDDNLNIVGNTIDYNGALASLGIQVGNALSSLVSQNTVSEQTSTTQAPTAISLETGFVSSSVTANNITKSLTTNTGGYGGRGITIGTGTAASNLTVANNFISGVNGSNFSGYSNSSAMGICIGTIGNSSTISTTAGGINLYYNSVTMTGSMGTGSTSAITTAFYVGSGASALDIRNNILSNTQVATSTTQKNYAIYSAAANTAFTNINYNDYYVSNSFNAASAVLGFLTSDRTNLAGIIAGFGQNANAINVAPVFTSVSDLHLVPSSNVALNDLGTPVAVTTDYDGTTRNATTPDMGADEFTPPTCVTAAGGTASGSASLCNSGTPTITATGYSSGTGTTYQWVSSTVSGDYPNAGTNFAGQTNPASLTTGVVSTTTYYWLRVTCGTNSSTDNSTLVTVTVSPSVASISGPSFKCANDPAVTLTENGGTGTSWLWSPGGATTQSISVNPAVTTDYTVQVTSPGGCVLTSAIKTLVVNAVPTGVTATATQTSLC
ncbi:MAG: hypothetical protein PSV16_06210, partial [Flavobacterium sp.]|nr:hypothetical protein [Flavobacterium sp.]